MPISTREELISGLHQAAEWFEAHPEVPLPIDPMLSIYVDPAEFKPLVRVMGSFQKEPIGDFFGIEKSFGPITFRVITDRSAVCTPIVVGKRVLPAQEARPEREVDVIEWKCEGQLL